MRDLNAIDFRRKIKFAFLNLKYQEKNNSFCDSRKIIILKKCYYFEIKMAFTRNRRFSFIDVLLHHDSKEDNQHGKLKLMQSIDCTPESFIIVKWRENKVYSILLNKKHVELDDFVTCMVNNKQDVGKVVFVGKKFTPSHSLS